MNKQTISIFLWTALVLTACSNSDNKNITTTTPPDINDTTFLKTVKWDSLNAYVDYHILQQGSKATDTNVNFILKRTAAYQYMQGKFELIEDSTTTKCNAHDLNQLILSDNFSDRTNFECLLRVNSHIGFQYRPDLLQTVFVSAKDTGNKSIKALMTLLKKETFTQDITTETANPNFLDTMTRSVFIKIKLKADYWDLKKINEICRQLNMRPDVDNAFFTDLFTGLNEQEMIYHLTTDEKNSR